MCIWGNNNFLTDILDNRTDSDIKGMEQWNSSVQVTFLWFNLYFEIIINCCEMDLLLWTLSVYQHRMLP